MFVRSNWTTMAKEVDDVDQRKDPDIRVNTDGTFRLVDAGKVRAESHPQAQSSGTTNYWDGDEEEEAATQPFTARAYDEPGPFPISVQSKESRKKERRLEEAWKEYRRLRNEYQEFIEADLKPYSFMDGRRSEEWKKACCLVVDAEEAMEAAHKHFLKAAKSPAWSEY